MNKDEKEPTDKNTVTTQDQAHAVKKKPPQEVIDKMNRAIVSAAKTGMTPAELEDQVYREMFGMDD